MTELVQKMTKRKNSDTDNSPENESRYTTTKSQGLTQGNEGRGDKEDERRPTKKPKIPAQEGDKGDKEDESTALLPGLPIGFDPHVEIQGATFQGNIIKKGMDVGTLLVAANYTIDGDKLPNPFDRMGILRDEKGTTLVFHGKNKSSVDKAIEAIQRDTPTWTCKGVGRTNEEEGGSGSKKRSAGNVGLGKG